MKPVFFNNCVNWNPDDVHIEGGLCEMIEESRNITRETFVRAVDSESRTKLEASLGYAPHDPTAILTMKRDHHVSYHRSRLHGCRVYFFKHSAIEYVFTSTTYQKGRAAR